MKRLLTALIAMALLVTIAPVAMAEHSEPILFRGIPWGSLRTDVVSELPKPSSTSGPTHQKYGTNIEKYVYGISEKLRNSENNATFTEELSYNDKSIGYKGMYVAGYKVERIGLAYVYSLDSDGHPDVNFDNGRLYLACYCISPTNNEATHKDLVNKLTKLYGDPDYNKSETSKTKNDTHTVWKGRDGTSVSLNLYESKEYSVIYIKYATQEGVDMRNEVLDAFKKMETPDPDDTSGL